LGLIRCGMDQARRRRTGKVTGVELPVLDETSAAFPPLG
jgi:hypothetical protein